MCGYAKEVKEDLKEYMDMIVQERLIGEEIIYYNFKNKRIMFSQLNIDEK